MKKIILGLSLILLANVSLASEGSSHIEKLRIGSLDGNMVFVKLYDIPTSRPSGCNATNLYHYAFDGSTEVGKKMYAMLLAARMAGSRVYFNGTGNCVTAPGGGIAEGLNYIFLRDEL